MLPTVIWLLGEPGAGKTALARALLGVETMRCTRTMPPAPKATKGWVFYAERVVAAGWYCNDPFDGADTVPYNGVVPWIDWWMREYVAPPDLTILDGDRFSHLSAMQEIRALRPTVRFACCMLELPAAVAAERRAARSSKVQNASWVKGRATKARRFFSDFNGLGPFPALRFALNGEHPTAALRDQTITILEGVR